VQSAGCTSQDGVIDDESLVRTRTNICLSDASAVPSYSVPIFSDYVCTTEWPVPWPSPEYNTVPVV
jgi:hypothetical protein